MGNVWKIAIILLFLVVLGKQVTAAAFEDLHEYLNITTGTGFYISNRNIVTNAHVIEECSEVMVRGAIPESKATVVAVDPEMDLAVLRTRVRPKGIAMIRSNPTSLKPGDKITVIGYPLEHGMTGKHLVRTGEVLALSGPVFKERHIEFSDAVEEGNSGGPLLDKNGNVIGVVVGYVELYQSKQAFEENAAPIKRSSVAITLKVLKEFLEEHKIFYRTNPTVAQYSTRRLESKAKRYLVNVQCIR